jgi:uracil-DNA glycosylase family 4
MTSRKHPPPAEAYDATCTRCPRLAAFLRETRAHYPDYWARPVPSFGDPGAALVIVGLAPGMHGANRTARPFTGDHAGILLYQTLFDAGLATAPVSVSADDGLELRNARIVNSVKCVPPQNKPQPVEIRTCNAFLSREMQDMPAVRVYLALGRVAHEAVLLARGCKRADYPFAHAGEHLLGGGVHLVDSYHCSRYNTQTRRLTAAMFRSVVARACELAQLPVPPRLKAA